MTFQGLTSDEVLTVRLDQLSRKHETVLFALNACGVARDRVGAGLTDDRHPKLPECRELLWEGKLPSWREVASWHPETLAWHRRDFWVTRIGTHEDLVAFLEQEFTSRLDPLEQLAQIK